MAMKSTTIRKRIMGIYRVETSKDKILGSYQADEHSTSLITVHVYAAGVDVSDVMFLIQQLKDSIDEAKLTAYKEQSA